MSGPAGTDLLRAPELRGVLAALAAAGALVLFLVSLGRGSGHLFSSYRDWTPVARGPVDVGWPRDIEFDPLSVLIALQTSPLEQRPFRLLLRLPVAPVAGAEFGAQHAFPVGPGIYCFTALAARPASALSPREIERVVDTVVEVNGQPVAELDFDDPHHGKWIEVRAIRPRNGVIEIGLILAARETRTGQRWEIPPVHVFEFARLWECGEP